MSVVFGVHIDEILLQFPHYTLDQVKAWRSSDKILPPDVVDWTYAIVDAGGLTCRCGKC